MASLDATLWPSIVPSRVVPSRSADLNQDVLHVICQFIQSSKDERTETSNSFRDRLRNAALAFNAMQGPALDALWHTLPSVIPLFSLHPCVMLDKNYYVLKPTTNNEWGVFDRYAVRVRCLSLLDRNPLNRHISPHVAEFLSRLRPHRALLPALTDIHLPKVGANFDGQTLLPIISNGLDTLEVNAVHNKTFVTTLLCYVGQFASSIRVLKARRIERSDHILFAIQNLHSLRTLDLENEYLDWPWFSNLPAHLPNLQHLSLGLSDAPGPSDLALKATGTNRRLKLITLRISGPEIASLILHYVDSDSLRFLAIKETKPNITAESVSALLSKVNQLLHLTRLLLEIREAVWGFNVDLLQVMMQLKCRGTLEELSLSGNKFITELSDHSIAQLTRNLPVLKRLSLPARCSQEVYPTLKLLLMLGRDAPTLQELRIPLQDLQLPPNYEDFTFSNGSLTKLSLCLVTICMGDYKAGFWGMTQNLASQVTPKLVETLYHRFPKLSKMEPYETNVLAARTAQDIFDKILGYLDFGRRCAGGAGRRSRIALVS